MNLDTIGEKIDDIEVSISHRIIELFSAGLYSSPNKAFEELVCNSYDAFASKVAVYVPSDSTVEGAYIWVCDNGEGLNPKELKNLWRIGESTKRQGNVRDKKRLQIGQFGIGKLATYILARKLTYISKKDGRYILATMDYNLIKEDYEKLLIDEREVKEDEAQILLQQYVDEKIIQFNLFGDNSEPTWTVSLMTELKPKAGEIKNGRLKWILSTALPLNPGFQLNFNGEKIESSKINVPVMKKWIIGKNDETAEKLKTAECKVSKEDDKEQYFVDFENLKGVHGEFILYEDSLVEGKSSELGRSHGIFLIIRGRLINLEDALLGMDAFSHGAFNRCRIIVNADELDKNLTSTREAVKDSQPFSQLKEYIKKKFNNEVRKYYFDQQLQMEEKKSVSSRMAQTSYLTSKKPIYDFVQNFYLSQILNPILIDKPLDEDKNELLSLYEKNLETGEQVIEHIEWAYKNIEEPIAKLNLKNRVLTINKAHPYVANYIDSNNNMIPLESMIITEVLTEAHLYELKIDEETVNTIIRKRDRTLRQLALADKVGIPAVAMYLKDSLSDPSGLEDAVARVLDAIGFEVTSIGGNGEPDGKAEAFLGYDENGKSRGYSLTYDAKSTAKSRIAAGTAHLSGLKRHQEKYKADYCMEVAIDYQGTNDDESAITLESQREKVTMISATDLTKLLLLVTPKQLGLDKLRDLFETCFSPKQVHEWIEKLEKKEVENPPYYDLVDVIYELQKTDTEAPVVEVVRSELNRKINKKCSSKEVAEWLTMLVKLVPGCVSVEGNYVSVQVKAEIIKDRIHKAISEIPIEIQPLYNEIFN